MAFDGWFIKINGIIFPNRFIAHESLVITPDQIMDFDPYRDGDGVLHRNALPHTATTIKFSTPHLEMSGLQIVNTYLTKENRVQCKVEYWNPNTFSYAEGDFYIADIPYDYINVNEIMKTALHKPIMVLLTEY